MAEKDVYQALRKAWTARGRLRRIEAKSVAGFVDLLACHQGLTFYCELKHVTYPIEPFRPSSYLGGLKGAQAIELRNWAKAGAPAYLIIGHNPRPPYDFLIYEGNRLLRLYELARSVQKGKVAAPEADLIMKEQFNWGKLFHHHRSLTQRV